MRRLPLFARLSPQQLEAVASRMQVLRFEASAIIYPQGSAPPGLLLLVSGSALQVQTGANGAERPVGQVQAGQFVDEPALLQEYASPVTLRATETTLIIFLARQQFQALTQQDPGLRGVLAFSQSAPPTAPSQPTPEKKAEFDHQREGEKVILRTFRHPYAFWGRATGLIIVILAVWFGGILLGNQVPGFPWLLIALGVTGLLGLLIFYYFLEWRNDVLVISDKRVVNIHKTIITFRTIINEIPLDAIHEVNVALPPVSDILGRAFGYGTIIIKTSGDSNNIALHEIPNPKAIQQAIFDNRRRYQEAKAEENREQMRDELHSFLRGQRAAGGGGSADGSTQPASGERPGLFAQRYTNDKGETVYRKHWLIWIMHTLLPLLVILGGMTLLLLNVVFPLIPFAVILFGILAVYIADWDWRNDLYIVGDQTVTIIHRRPFFLQDQKEQILLSQVDNVVSDMTGFWNSIFSIGEVRMMLSGADEKNAKRFTMVHNPQAVQQEIARRQERASEFQEQENANRQRQAIMDYLSLYHETTGQAAPPAAPPPAPAPSSGYSPPVQPTYKQPVVAQSTNQRPPNPPPPAEEPPPVRRADGVRPPGIPRTIRRDNPPQT
jgi:Cyclic nucleotide-binding domain/Bacterial PH domain